MGARITISISSRVRDAILHSAQGFSVIRGRALCYKMIIKQPRRKYFKRIASKTRMQCRRPQGIFIQQYIDITPTKWGRLDP